MKQLIILQSLLIFLFNGVKGEDFYKKDFEKIKIIRICKVFYNKDFITHNKRVEKYSKEESLNEVFKAELEFSKLVVEMHNKHKEKILGYPILENLTLNDNLKMNIKSFLRQLQIKSPKESAPIGTIAGCIMMPKYIIEFENLNKEVQYIIIDIRGKEGEELNVCSNVDIYSNLNDKLVLESSLKISSKNKDVFFNFEEIYLNDKKIADNSENAKENEKEKEKEKVEKENDGEKNKSLPQK